MNLLSFLNALAVVIFVVDDLGYNEVGFTNGESRCTPFIDTLAGEGVILTNFYVAPDGSGTRSSLLTSRYPHTYGLNHHSLTRQEEYGLNLTIPLWSEILAQSGVDTGMFGKWHLGSHRRKYTPTYRGFKHFTGFYGGSLDYYNHDDLNGYDWFISDGADFDLTSAGRYSGELLYEVLAEYMATRDRRQPVFLQISLQTAHHPMEMPPPIIDYNVSCHYLDSEYVSSRMVYNAMMQYVDSFLQRVVRLLEQHGITGDNSVFALTSDGGASTSFGGGSWFRGEKGDVYEGGIRVPAVIWGRDVPHMRYGYPVHVIDLLPTLIDIAGWDVSLPNVDGVSMWDGIRWNTDVRKEILLALDWCDCPFEYVCTNPCQCPPKPNNISDWKVSGAIYLNGWKLILKQRRAELFRIITDPFELTDFSSEFPSVVDQLLARMDYYLRHGSESSKPPCNPFLVPVDNWWLPEDYFRK